MSVRLTQKQEEIIAAPLGSKLFLSGAAGTGKTTTGVRRLRQLIDAGVPAHSILVLVPQRRLALPYYNEIRNPRRKAGAEATVATLGSLSHQTVNLFWPLIAGKLSQNEPYRRPAFLSSELIQYLMFKLLEPQIERNDYFNSVTITRPRLFGQLADNLNKSALVGFSHTTLAQRLKTALPGDAEQAHIYDDAQACANLFRDYCLEHRLLDFSLQVALFIEYLWKHSVPRAYLTQRYKHVIADNIEEDTPVTHQLLRDWLPGCQSVLLIYDEAAGYRRFLGADDVSAESLQELCSARHQLDATRVMSPPVQALLGEVSELMTGDAPEPPKRKADAGLAISFTPATHSRFHTQMVDWVADSIAALVREDGVKQNQIVILAPLMSDSLRFSLTTRLESHGVRTYSLRPSRPLYAEPAVRALVTLAKLAHPNWQIAAQHQVKKFDVVQMLLGVVAELDLARATLLAEVRFVGGRLLPFQEITKNPEMRSRITEVFGERFDQLVGWLDAYRAAASETPEPIDIFFSRLFSEVLSQKGFSFHFSKRANPQNAFDEARIIANLIDSSRSFRQTLNQIEPETDAGQEYARMVDAGILADQYEPRDWKKSPDAVLIAPAYTFLLSNQPVEYQFWLNIDSPVWTRRLQQPLTHPYVLSRQWPPGRVWTEADEQQTSREMLLRVVTGLLRRCRKKVFIGFSKFDERGNEREGELRVIFDLLLRNLGSADVPSAE
ncbi:MAG TPA: AAA family ATPase [Blastocatellia bacterium]|nr:AAA family ATPase [Blastocatellia bacterium]HMX28517.1 AAA family ATPase [Blastocatellia bacterium]HMY73698.1 AAA family ATPase [Blastocatellia bacterium]HMZ21748.1 AAA family ATPase [Blastocatellia bacterium]HNG32184.1 AAA family ATPase [Blastocatellia bacterium]